MAAGTAEGARPIEKTLNVRSARAANTLDPSRIAEYLFELCKSFAFIFSDKTNHPIVNCEDEELRLGRLLLAAAIGHALKAGLTLLGIEPLEEM